MSSGPSTHMMRIAIAGGGGFARVLAQELSQTAHALIVLSTRAQPEFDCQVAVVDYGNIDDLRFALQGVELVVSTISGAEQLNLIEAARRARVRHFVPSEFEGQLSRRPRNDPIDRGSSRALESLERCASDRNICMGYTVFSCGVFYERFAPGGLRAYGIGSSCKFDQEGGYLVNISRRTAEIPQTDFNGQSVYISMTSLFDVARFVAIAIEIGLENWPRELKMRGALLTPQQLVDICQEIRGGQFEVISRPYGELWALLRYYEASQDWSNWYQMMEMIQTANGRYSATDVNPKGIPRAFPFQPMGIKSWLQEVYGDCESVNQSSYQPDKNSEIGNRGTTGLPRQATQPQGFENFTQMETQIDIPPKSGDHLELTTRPFTRSATNETAPTTEPSTAPWTAHDDNRTLYSDTSSIIDTALNLHISELADALVKGTRAFHHQGLDKILEVLADRLKAFALMIGLDTQNQIHLNIMTFVYRKRRQIVHCFLARVESLDGSRPPEQLPDDKIGLNDLMDLWSRNLDIELSDPRPDPGFLDDPGLSDVEPEDEGETPVPELPAYRKAIFGSDAYNWLISSLQRDLRLFTTDFNHMEKIRQDILHWLPPSSRHISRKSAAETHQVVFEMGWDILKFLDTQNYRDPRLKISTSHSESLQMALTLTGSSTDAQAVPCSYYLTQTWPATGKHMMALLVSIISRPSGWVETAKLPSQTVLKASHRNGFLKVEASGTADMLAEVGQQLAWVGAALRLSPYAEGIAVCHPAVKKTPAEGLSGNGPASFKLEFRFASPQQTKSGNGDCWHEMFRNTVIVMGYPIPWRTESNTGLEMPLSVMADLLSTTRINIFNGGIFIKGFSSMLVPVRHCDELVIWHHIYGPAGTRISYLSSTTAQPPEIDLGSLADCRHVVGWCSEVKYIAGSRDICHGVERSRLPFPHLGCMLEKCSVTCGKFITGGVTASLGVRDTPIRIARGNYIARLEGISQKYVVLWDEHDKRGWLVNGTSALLHLVRCSLHFNLTSKFRCAYKFRLEDIAEAAVPHTAESAIEVLMNPENRKLAIHAPARSNPTHGTGADPALASSSTGLAYCFEDRVEELYECLEKIIDHELSANAQPGIKIKPRARKHLEGWDFKDLVTNHDPLPAWKISGTLWRYMETHTRARRDSATTSCGTTRTAATGNVLLPSATSRKFYKRFTGTGDLAAVVFGNNITFPVNWKDHGDPELGSPSSMPDFLQVESSPTAGGNDRAEADVSLDESSRDSPEDRSGVGGSSSSRRSFTNTPMSWLPPLDLPEECESEDGSADVSNRFEASAISGLDEVQDPEADRGSGGDEGAARGTGSPKF